MQKAERLYHIVKKFAKIPSTSMDRDPKQTSISEEYRIQYGVFQRQQERLAKCERFIRRKANKPRRIYQNPNVQESDESNHSIASSGSEPGKIQDHNRHISLSQCAQYNPDKHQTHHEAVQGREQRPQSESARQGPHLAMQPQATSGYEPATHKTQHSHISPKPVNQGNPGLNQPHYVTDHVPGSSQHHRPWTSPDLGQKQLNQHQATAGFDSSSRQLQNTQSLRDQSFQGSPDQHQTCHTQPVAGHGPVLGQHHYPMIGPDQSMHYNHGLQQPNNHQSAVGVVSSTRQDLSSRTLQDQGMQDKSGQHQAYQQQPASVNGPVSRQHYDQWISPDQSMHNNHGLRQPNHNQSAVGVVSSTRQDLSPRTLQDQGIQGNSVQHQAYQPRPSTVNGPIPRQHHDPQIGSYQVAQGIPLHLQPNQPLAAIAYGQLHPGGAICNQGAQGNSNPRQPCQPQTGPGQVTQAHPGLKTVFQQQNHLQALQKMAQRFELLRQQHRPHYNAQANMENQQPILKSGYNASIAQPIRGFATFPAFSNPFFQQLRNSLQHEPPANPHEPSHEQLRARYGQYGNPPQPAFPCSQINNGQPNQTNPSYSNLTQYSRRSGPNHSIPLRNQAPIHHIHDAMPAGSQENPAVRDFRPNAHSNSQNHGPLPIAPDGPNYPVPLRNEARKHHIHETVQSMSLESIYIHEQRHMPISHAESNCPFPLRNETPRQLSNVHNCRPQDLRHSTKHGDLSVAQATPNCHLPSRNKFPTHYGHKPLQGISQANPEFQISRPLEQINSHINGHMPVPQMPVYRPQQLLPKPPPLQRAPIPTTTNQSGNDN